MDEMKIHPSARIVWMINGLIFSIIFITIAAVVYRYVHFIFILICAIIISIYSSFIYPFLEYRQWSYKISNLKIEYSHGIFFRKRTIIPVSRVQHLDIKQGPVQRYFKLSTIVIYTAGQFHQIEAVLLTEAQQIVDNINILISEETDNG